MKKLALFVMVSLVVMALPLPVFAVAYAQNEAALAWLRQAQEADGGFSTGFAEGSDFGATAEVILAAVASGQDVSTWVAESNLSPLDYVAAQLAAGRVTDVGNLSKAVFVAVATGHDPRAFGGRDLVAALLAAQDAGTGWFGDTLFKHAYAVLALHNTGTSVPQSAVTAMTAQFTDDGAWALFGGTEPGTADTNTTALVMQALVAVGEVDAAAGALPYLQRMQNDDGGFPYQKPSPWGTETDANSTAVVLQALNALDVQLGTWAPHGTDPLGALLALADADSGAYLWQAAVPFDNLLATAQAVQATEGMTLVDLARVGASRPAGTTASNVAPAPEAGSAILLPASGAAAGPTAGLMIAVVAMACLSALLRRR